MQTLKAIWVWNIAYKKIIEFSQTGCLHYTVYTQMPTPENEVRRTDTSIEALLKLLSDELESVEFNSIDIFGSDGQSDIIKYDPSSTTDNRLTYWCIVECKAIVTTPEKLVSEILPSKYKYLK